MEDSLLSTLESGDMPVRCFTCGKVVGNKYSTYKYYVGEGYEIQVALDKVGVSRGCCRRMLQTHVDLSKWLLMYPTYEDNIQRIGNFDEIPEGVEEDDIGDIDEREGSEAENLGLSDLEEFDEDENE